MSVFIVSAHQSWRLITLLSCVGARQNNFGCTPYWSVPVHISEFLLHIYLGITGHQPIKTCNIVQAYVSLTHRGGGQKGVVVHVPRVSCCGDAQGNNMRLDLSHKCEVRWLILVRYVLRKPFGGDAHGHNTESETRKSSQQAEKRTLMGNTSKPVNIVNRWNMRLKSATEFFIVT